MSKSRPTEKQFSLIRLFIALAWADGEISNAEMNYLKDFFFKLDLTGEDWAKIEMYLEEPVLPEEAESLIQDFVGRLSGAREREEVIRFLEGLVSSDGAAAPEEKAFLERCTAIFREAGPASALIGRIRGLFQEAVLKPAAASKREEELQDFLNNRVLFNVRRKLEREKLTLEADPDALAYAALFGGLLGHVAAVHDGVSKEEMAVLKRHLKDIAGFDDEAVEVVVSVVEDSAARGLDAFRLTRTFYARSNKTRREQLLDCLFDVAGADDDLAHAEVEAVRDIAYGLKFSHREFIDAKLRYRDRAKEA
ncbi:MAG: TerB family tellurite resistance protein [Nitrospiria bacterium]